MERLDPCSCFPDDLADVPDETQPELDPVSVPKPKRGSSSSFFSSASVPAGSSRLSWLTPQKPPQDPRTERGRGEKGGRSRGLFCARDGGSGDDRGSLSVMVFFFTVSPSSSRAGRDERAGQFPIGIPFHPVIPRPARADRTRVLVSGRSIWLVIVHPPNRTFQIGARSARRKDLIE